MIKLILIIGLLFIIMSLPISAYSSMVIVNGHIINFDKGVDRIVYMQVLKFVPFDCNFRLDVVSRNNVRWNGYAWYSGRITIYDGNNLDDETKQYVLMHEVGHVCAVNNRIGSYYDREVNADKYTEMINYDR